MLGIRCVSVGVGECWSEEPFVCFGENPLRPRSPTEPEEDEGRKVSEVNGRNQWTEQGSRQNRAVGRKEQELEPVDSEVGLANVRGWVSVLDGFVEISLEYTLMLAHRCTENYAKVTQTSLFLHLELTQICVYLFSFLSILSCVCCVLCVRKEMWNTPGRRWEKPRDNRMAMSGLGDWDSRGRLAVYCQITIKQRNETKYSLWIWTTTTNQTCETLLEK